MVEETMSAAHAAVETGDVEALRALLDAGADIHQEFGGMTLLHHAVDSEIDAHGQTGDPLSVSLTAYLVARGADPRRKSHGGTGLSVEHVAFVSGHWMATAIFEAWELAAPASRSPRGHEGTRSAS
ncbi:MULTISPECIES: ankyrin repeat domain-containing protein [unclassified Kitasatospora]|uniref:ankyrin repeat domain-containing protein n=1 Tax=unclassified Kitasatospora TaxID=2633591 RepID=UPI00343EE426